MPQVEKKVMLTHVKSVFGTLRRAAADPLIWLDKLPDDPVLFLRDCKGMYDCVYGVGEGAVSPSPPKIDMRQFAALEESYSCRGLGKSSLWSATPAFHRQLEQEEPAVAALKRAAQMLQDMQFQRPQPQPPANLVIEPLQRRPTLSLSLQQSSATEPLARAGGPLRLADVPHTAATEEHDTPPPESPPVLSLAVPTAQPTNPAKSDDAVAEINEMLDSLAQKKARAKAKASGSSPAGPAMPHALAASTAAEASGPSSAAVAPSSSAVVPAAKASGASSSAAAPAAKASGTSSSAVAPAAGFQLGCSKCRWKSTGCAQCRKPGFKGLRAAS